MPHSWSCPYCSGNTKRLKWAPRENGGNLQIDIRRARGDDAEALTRIAHDAKRHWGYAERHIRSWRADLTISPKFIADHHVFCATQGPVILGFYAVAGEGSNLELVHMWVAPERLGEGIGSHLFRHATELAREVGAAVLRIEADPNAEAFYLKMGAKKIGAVPSTILGRELPLLEADVS